MEILTQTKILANSHSPERLEAINSHYYFIPARPSLLSVQKKNPKVIAATAIKKTNVPILFFILLLVYNNRNPLRGMPQILLILQHTRELDTRLVGKYLQ